MPYSEEMAERVRGLLDAPYEERKMFGGVAFMVNTHMACGVMGDDLMLRVGKDAHDEAIERGAQGLTHGGRRMRGMVVVPGDLDDRALGAWVDQAVAFAQSEPPKMPKL
jgi:TfoX/Sxy family transcriptional regulator of competence genes